MSRPKDQAAEEAAANIALARAMGSTCGYDPIPPEQYLKWTDKRFPPKIRVWAWRLSRTIRQGHRSPFCVDLNRKPVTQAQCRADLKIDRGLLSRVWHELNQDGFGREEEGKTFVCGKVDLPPETQSESDTSSDEASVDCTVNTPASILLEINKLDPALCTATKRRISHIQAAANLGRARQIAAWRLAESEAIDYVLQQVKIKPPARKEKADDLKEAAAALRPVFEPLTVQSTPQNEQSTNGPVYSAENPVYSGKNGAHPYIQSKAEKTSTTLSPHQNGNGRPAAAATSGNGAAASPHTELEKPLTDAEYLEASTRCADLSVGIPDRTMAANVKRRFPEIPIREWPKLFDKQKGLGAMLTVSRERVLLEWQRQQHPEAVPKKPLNSLAQEMIQDSIALAKRRGAGR